MPKARTIAKVLGVLAAATAGVLAVQEARRRMAEGGDGDGDGGGEDADDEDGDAAGRPVGRTSRTARNAAMAGVGAKAGGSYALHRARRAFASAERQAELDVQFELKTAEAITDALGNMKGALMKLGQMASYLDQGLPEHVRAALAELQSNAPPMSAELAAAVVEEELGAPPAAVFATWDPVPIASASIGQVHRAITHDGRAVAVKVQYPGVAAAIMADLDNAGLLFGAMGMLFPGLDPEPLVAELRERLAEELDYQLEAANQRLFADHYRGHPFIHVPDVVDELSAARVLTTELAEGERFDVLETWDQAERDLAAETIFRFVFGSLYRLHAFNGDPHPGNYLFRPGGQVTFLDFGLVKRFVPEEIAVLESMIQAMVLDHDIPRYRRIVEDIGMLQAGASFTDQQVEDYFGHFYDFVLVDEVRTITPEYASETVRRFFDTSGPFGPIMKAANVPPAFVIIQRINLGLYAIFGQLRATANWRRISEELWPIVDGPPSTELGRQAAAWAAANGR
jgi:predicted unusual protein kinase regulating ubiquinone biosynthesis (AarF/ABC1/UbiB family)